MTCLHRVTADHETPLRMSLSVRPIQFPLSPDPQTPRPHQSHLTGRSEPLRGNGSRKKQRSTRQWLNSIPFANLTKTQDPGNTMLGLFPGPWKGPEHVRAWSLNFLCSGQWASACGRQDGVGGGGSGPQPPARAPWKAFPQRTPQPPAHRSFLALLPWETLLWCSSCVLWVRRRQVAGTSPRRCASL